MKRVDGRDNKDLRRVRITPGYLRFAEGSVLVEVGETRIICAATVEEKVPPFLKGHNKGWVTAEYSLLPRSTKVRTVRDAARGQVSGRSQEIQRLIGRSLRSVVDLEAMGERTIWVDCDVIQADGGTRTASITGGYVALVLALNQLVLGGTLSRLPVTDFLAAISVGRVNGEVMLDLAFAEDSQAQVDMNVVMTGSRRLVEIQGTAEGSPFSRPELEEMLDLAQEGIDQLVSLQQEVLLPLAGGLEGRFRE